MDNLFMFFPVRRGRSGALAVMGGYELSRFKESRECLFSERTGGKTEGPGGC